MKSMLISLHPRIILIRARAEAGREHGPGREREEAGDKPVCLMKID